MTTRTRAVLALCGVFLLGSVAGAGASHAVAHHRFSKMLGGDRHEFSEKRRLRALARHLDLSGVQRDRIATIMREHSGERRALMRRMFHDCGGQVRAHHEKVNAEISQELSDKQRQKFSEIADAHTRRFLGGDRPEAPDREPQKSTE